MKGFKKVLVGVSTLMMASVLLVGNPMTAEAATAARCSGENSQTQVTLQRSYERPSADGNDRGYMNSPSIRSSTTVHYGPRLDSIYSGGTGVSRTDTGRKTTSNRPTTATRR